MDYPVLPDLSPDGTIYFNAVMETVEAMVPPGCFATAHAPAMLEVPNGDLLCAWFAGSCEGNTDVSIVCARLKKDALKWDAPVQISHDAHRSEQNPSLFLAPGGEVWVVYTAQLGKVPGKINMQFTSVIRRQRSTNGGLTWSEPDLLFGRQGSFCRQPIQILKSGRWIFSNWLCSEGHDDLSGDPTVFQISDDGGTSWHTAVMPDSSGKVHANVVELEDGHLAAFMRSRAADYIYRSESLDNGNTWSTPESTVLPNNNSSISAIKLSSGRIALAYNPTHTARPVSGVAAWPGLRCPVAVALSEDGGLTWPLIRHMEQGEGFVGSENETNNRQYEYPCLVQTKDEMLNLAFAYQSRRAVKWMRFSEADVIGKKW